MRGRTTSTGQGACCTTRPATLPSQRCFSPDRPRLDITTRIGWILRGKIDDAVPRDAQFDDRIHRHSAKGPRHQRIQFLPGGFDQILTVGSRHGRHGRHQVKISGRRQHWPHHMKQRQTGGKLPGQFHSGGYRGRGLPGKIYRDEEVLQSHVLR